MIIKPKILIALLSTFYLLFFGIAFASKTNGTITSGGNNGYAWSDQTGWVNFAATNGNIQITDLPAGQAGSAIVGYAWNTNFGWINMSPANGGVTVAANGALSGYAWGSGLGWINFSGVSINSSGKFTGTASGANVGTLTFDCANCSVTTDFRAQNFRAVAVAEVPVVSAVSSGAGFRAPSVNIPSHINAYNVPLNIDNDQQSGTLTQTFTGDLSAGVDVPRGSIGGRIIITVAAAAIDQPTITKAIRVISNALFNVTATDGNGNPVHTFASPIRIALQVQEELQNRSDIGVYFFDEENKRWERVPDVQFDGAIARFYVDHLTVFSIFGGLDLPQFIEQFSPIPGSGIFEGVSGGSGVSVPTGITEIEAEEGVGAFERGSLEKAKEEFLPAQLFDINLEIENTKIAGLKDLVARVLFTSFGRVPTLVDLTFDILNESGEKVYSVKDGITVQTQAVLTKRFADAEEILEIGKYTLLVTTVYNTDVVDEFRQDFEIAGEGAIKKPFWRSLWFWGISTIFLFIILFVVVKKIKDNEENKGDNTGVTY